MKKKISGIYKIENLINHKVYIGQSKDVNTRWSEHKSTAFYEKGKSYNNPLYRAIRKYGIENFSFEVLIETYDRNYWEIFLIQIYHATDDNFGYNIENGGNCGSPIRTEEEKEKIKEMRKEIYRNLPDDEKKRLAKEHSEKMRKRIQEKGLTEAEKEYHDSQKNKRPLCCDMDCYESNYFVIDRKGKNNGMFGKHRTEEEKKHLSELHKGKKGIPHTEEHKNKIKGGANPSAMKIQCVETKETFDTCKEAFEKYNIDNKYKNDASLIGVLDKPTRMWRGYHWIRLTKRKRILCVETNKIYKSFSEAEKDTKIPKNTINQCCLGRTEYGGIYHWKYIE